MNIYQDALGGWILFDGTAKHKFDTEQEARQAMAKIDTAKEIVRTVQSLAKATDSAGDLEAEYFDAAGAGWVDADVAALGITAAQLAGCITLLQQIPKLMLGEITENGYSAVTPAMYRSTLNVVRRVQT